MGSRKDLVFLYESFKEIIFDNIDRDVDDGYATDEDGYFVCL